MDLGLDENSLDQLLLQFDEIVRLERVRPWLTAVAAYIQKARASDEMDEALLEAVQGLHDAVEAMGDSHQKAAGVFVEAAARRGVIAAIATAALEP